MSVSELEHDFYGYKMVQNPSNESLTLYMGAIDAKVLRHIVSVDNPVKWDESSGVWKSGGRNRTIEEGHWKAIRDFLTSANLERILPAPIVISVEGEALEFTPTPGVEPKHGVTPGLLTITAKYQPGNGTDAKPVKEAERTAWVLDGQHRITAFREWAMPDPYPVNVVLLKAWKGDDYEDAMRHQTYELNMGRPLSEDFKAAVREQYNQQLGHPAYKRQIALSWIRKDLEARGRAFSSDRIVGAPKLRTPYVLKMSFVEKLIELAFDSDPYLSGKFDLEEMSGANVKAVGKYLFDFYEGVRLSIGLLNPNTKGTIGAGPDVQNAKDYWDIADKTSHKQRLLHNVGLKAVTRGLLHLVMQGNPRPKSPKDVAKVLDHLRGIAWHDPGFQSKKDDWVAPLAGALKEMLGGKGTTGGKKYQLLLQKRAPDSGNVIDSYTLEAYGWT